MIDITKPVKFKSGDEVPDWVYKVRKWDETIGPKVNFGQDCEVININGTNYLHTYGVPFNRVITITGGEGWVADGSSDVSDRLIFMVNKSELDEKRRLHEECKESIRAYNDYLKKYLEPE